MLYDRSKPLEITSLKYLISIKQVLIIFIQLNRLIATKYFIQTLFCRFGPLEDVIK